MQFPQLAFTDLDGQQNLLLSKKKEKFKQFKWK